MLSRTEVGGAAERGLETSCFEGEGRGREEEVVVEYQVLWKQHVPRVMRKKQRP